MMYRMDFVMIAGSCMVFKGGYTLRLGFEVWAWAWAWVWIWVGIGSGFWWNLEKISVRLSYGIGKREKGT
jgi:hypothetical protein